MQDPTEKQIRDCDIEPEFTKLRHVNKKCLEDKTSQKFPGSKCSMWLVLLTEYDPLGTRMVRTSADWCNGEDYGRDMEILRTDFSPKPDLYLL